MFGGREGAGWEGRGRGGAGGRGLACLPHAKWVKTPRCAAELSGLQDYSTPQMREARFHAKAAPALVFLGINVSHPPQQRIPIDRGTTVRTENGALIAANSMRVDEGRKWG